MKKVLGLILILTMMVALVAGCGTASTTTAAPAATTAAAGETTAAAAEKFVVGYTNLADTDVFTMSRKNAFIEAVKADPSIEIKFADANGDIQKQLDQINTFIAQKVNAIIIVPVDYDGIVPGVEAANKAGIPVIALGIQSNGGDYCYVGSKNYDAGFMQGEFIAKNLPENGKVLYLEGEPGLYHSTERKQGFADALKSRTDITILDSVTGNYDKAKGMNVMQDWIQKYPNATDFQAVVAANDQMALGAMEALKTSGRLEGVMISGIDGVKDALTAIKAGEMSQSIFQNAVGQADGGFQVIQMLKKGEDPGEQFEVPFESIDSTNVDTYMALVK